MNEILVGSTNPVILTLTGGHKESKSITVKCTNGHFTSGKMDIYVRGDLNLKSEYITLEVAGNSLGKLSSHKEDLIYHKVKTNEDISQYISKKSEFVIKATPSNSVHPLWKNEAWGVLMNLSYTISGEKVVTASNWKLNERAFEPEDNAIYTFDLENTSGYNLKNVQVSLGQGEKWYMSKIDVISPKGLTWNFPTLNAGSKETLSLGLKSNNSPVGKYTMPQLTVVYEYTTQSVDFEPTDDFVVEISPD